MGEMRGRRGVVVTFASTFDALEAERLCGRAGVPGRLIPTPSHLSAECGLAWRLPPDAASRSAFERAVVGAVVPAAFVEVLG